jgi:hypothetical protein
VAKLTGKFVLGTARPLVSGRVTIPRLRTSRDIWFLVDTGADLSVVSAAEGLSLGFDPAELGDGVEIAGFAGRARHHVEPAFLSFITRGRAYVYRIPILVTAPSPDLYLLPSILGRDILNRWDMSYRPSRGSLTFDIGTADEIMHVT